MSCNGCRVLRKGCSESCILRQSLQWIGCPQAQANATVFVAKFFGRASLMSFISAVPESQRPSLFQSLLFEAVGRTVNPVGGAVGLLWTGNWNICQKAVETVLCHGTLHPLPYSLAAELDYVSEYSVSCYKSREDKFPSKRKSDFDDLEQQPTSHLDLGLTPGFPYPAVMKRRAATPSKESETTTSFTRPVKCCSEGGGER